MPLLSIGDLTTRGLSQPAAALARLRCLVINRVEWPESEYLVDRQRKFIYCPIAKVACSSVKRWFLSLQGETLPEGADEHVAAQRHRLRELSATAAWRILDDPAYFRFTFVRNPWARLVSAYLNKFLGATDCARHVAVRLGRRLPRADASDAPFAVTFAEFVRFLTHSNPARFDVHWRPQSYYLKRHTFDFVGRFEQLTEDFTQLQQRLGTGALLPRLNATRYERPERAGPLVADQTPQELLSKGELPGYRQFYSAELREQVGRLYAADIRLFGYEFDGG